MSGLSGSPEGPRALMSLSVHLEEEYQSRTTAARNDGNVSLCFAYIRLTTKLNVSVNVNANEASFTIASLTGIP
jgi:hypothetical protein